MQPLHCSPRWDSSSPTPPRSPAPWQYPNPAPQEAGRGRVPQDPGCSIWVTYQHSHPSRDAGLRGCGNILHWLNPTPFPAHPDTHPPTPIFQVEASVPLHRYALPALSHAFTQRLLCRPLAPGRGQPRTKARQRRRGPRQGWYLLRDSPSPNTGALQLRCISDPSLPRATSSPLPPDWDPPLGHTPFHSYTQPNKEADPQSGFMDQVSLRVPNSNSRRSQECPLPSLQADIRVGAPK